MESKRNSFQLLLFEREIASRIIGFLDYDDLEELSECN